MSFCPNLKGKLIENQYFLQGGVNTDFQKQRVFLETLFRVNMFDSASYITTDRQNYKILREILCFVSLRSE